jgi:hypothetical protein
MKTKQLANVLIKILGLSVIIHGIPSVMTGFFTGFRIRGDSSQAGYYWPFWLSYLILPAIGIYLVLKSRDVATFLFKDEDE